MAEEFDLLKEISEITDPKALRIITYLLEKIVGLEAKILVLEEKIARLEKTSSNSSKPPSSDITKPLNENRQPGIRKSGGQPKHVGKTRKFFLEDQIDRKEELKLESCPDCGESLVGSADLEPLIQHTAELKEKPLEIVEYRRIGQFCKKCRIIHYPALPSGVIEGQLCGPRLQALLGYMKGNLGASYMELSQFCEDVFGLGFSKGMICNVIARVNEALKIPYEEVPLHIRQEKALNIDESGWRDRGSQYWIWLFCTKSVAFFTIQKSRGCKVLKEVLGETFDGAIISDFYSAYVCYANLNQQFCLAHLIRDIKFLTTLPDPRNAKFGKEVLECFRTIFEYWHDRDKIPREIFLKQCDQTQRKLFTFLLNSPLEKGEGLTMKKRLIKHWKSLFRFIQEPDIYQPTNNLAEQTLRPIVRIRRQTQGSRSEWGRAWASRSMSIIVSCKKQKRSSWEFFSQAINAKYFGTDYPSIIKT